MKKIGYLIYAFWFHIFRLFPVKENQIFMVATHDDSEEGNIGMTAGALRKHNCDFRITMMTKADGIHRPIRFFIRLPYEMARAKYIFLDNVFLPMAFLNFSGKTKVVQLWHGTGTIKKFGQDINTGELATLEQRANQRITHLIVNSECTKKQYAKAFGVNENFVFVLGLPRSDLFFQEKQLSIKKRNFYREYPELAGKRLILYAPTFRDEQVACPELGLDLHRFLTGLEEEDILILRLHPHVAANFSDRILDQYEGKVLNLSKWKEVTTLMAASEILITDYSSIVFEYCLLEKPMIFYAYDLPKFHNDGRSFYENYEKYVPGKVVKTEQELLYAIENIQDEWKKAKQFKEENFAYLDGRATERLLHLILENEIET